MIIEHDVGQVGLGQAGGDGRTQTDKAIGLLHPVEPRQHRRAALEAQIGVARQVGDGALVGGVEVSGREWRSRPGPSSERPRARSTAGLAASQAAPASRPRAGSAKRRLCADVQIAPLERLAGRLEHGEDVGAVVDDRRVGVPRGLAEHVAAPTGGDAGGGGLGGVHARPGAPPRQEGERLADGLGCRPPRRRSRVRAAGRTAG